MNAFTLEIDIDADHQYFTKPELVRLFGVSRYRVDRYLAQACDDSPALVRTQGSKTYQINSKSIRYYAPDVAEILGVSEEKYKKLLKEYIERELDKQ